jgi:23S rRNA (adenine2503-C2)-methyltransferase
MEVVKRWFSADSITTKYVHRTTDNYFIEASYINRKEKHIICVSTQVGCIVGCRFCVSGVRGKKRFKRGLTYNEIVEQCLHIIKDINFEAEKKPLLISLMGEGEPFLNFTQCLKALNELFSLNWSVPIRFSISTSGIRPDLIKRLGEKGSNLPLKLQISLHGPTDSVRQQLIPFTKPLAEILEAAREYEKSGGRIDWNYVMCEGVNDHIENADILCKILPPGAHVKFNRLNTFNGLRFEKVSYEKVQYFRKLLEMQGYSTEYYETDGSDINATCGQLSYSFQEALLEK